MLKVEYSMSTVDMKAGLIPMDESMMGMASTKKWLND